MKVASIFMRTVRYYFSTGIPVRVAGRMEGRA